MLNQTNIKQKIKNFLINHFCSRLYLKVVFHKTKQIIFKKSKNILLLSFDCDKIADIEALPAVLMILQKHNVKASFAIPANYLDDYQHLFSQLVQEKHELINHTFSHPDNFIELPLNTKKVEIEQADKLFKNILDYQCLGFRAPHFGWLYYKPEILFEINKHLKELGYKYSSSSVLSWFLEKRFLEYNKDTTVLEIPLTPNPLRPLEPFDSYYFFKNLRSANNRDFNKEKRFLQVFKKSLKYGANYRIPLNFYFDPQDVIKNNLLNKLLTLAINNNFYILTYKDIL